MTSRRSKLIDLNSLSLSLGIAFYYSQQMPAFQRNAFPKCNDLWVWLIDYFLEVALARGINITFYILEQLHVYCISGN